ncbi:hypothetical protein SNEBB_004730 [Seison nebaliae]|nr:hypothetical protein SNEBB_004730 [Seison nebaliae]
MDENRKLFGKDIVRLLQNNSNDQFYSISCDGNLGTWSSFVEDKFFETDLSADECFSITPYCPDCVLVGGEGFVKAIQVNRRENSAAIYSIYQCMNTISALESNDEFIFGSFNEFQIIQISRKFIDENAFSDQYDGHNLQKILQDEDSFTYHGHTSNILSIALIGNGKHFASSSCDGSIRLWCFRKKTSLKALHYLPRISFYSFNTKHRAIVCVTNEIVCIPNNTIVEFYEMEENKMKKIKELTDRTITQAINIAKLNDIGTLLAIGLTDGSLYVFQYDKLKLIEKFNKDHSSIMDIIWGDDDSTIFYSNNQGMIMKCCVQSRSKSEIVKDDCDTGTSLSELKKSLGFPSQTVDDINNYDDFFCNEDGNENNSSFIDDSKEKKKKNRIISDDFDMEEENSKTRDGENNEKKKLLEVDRSPLMDYGRIGMEKMKNYVENMMKINVRKSFISGSFPRNGNEKIMKWNSIGQIIMYWNEKNGQQSPSIDINFFDVSVHHSMIRTGKKVFGKIVGRMKDDANMSERWLRHASIYELADISKTCYVLACPFKKKEDNEIKHEKTDGDNDDDDDDVLDEEDDFYFLKLDDEVDDEEEKLKKSKVKGTPSQLCCVSFGGGNQNEWRMAMNDDESIIQIRCNEEVIVCVTNKNNLRIFTRSGIERCCDIMKLTGNIISLTISSLTENDFHQTHSNPLTKLSMLFEPEGSNEMKMDIYEIPSKLYFGDKDIDPSSYQMLMSCRKRSNILIPIEKKKNIIWIGYSPSELFYFLNEDYEIFFYSSIRDVFIKVIDLKQISKSFQFYPISINDSLQRGLLYGIFGEMNENEYCVVNRSSILKSYPLQLDLVQNRQGNELEELFQSFWSKYLFGIEAMSLKSLYVPLVSDFYNGNDRSKQNENLLKIFNELSKKKMFEEAKDLTKLMDQQTMSLAKKFSIKTNNYQLSSYLDELLRKRKKEEEERSTLISQKYRKSVCLPNEFDKSITENNYDKKMRDEPISQILQPRISKRKKYQTNLIATQLSDDESQMESNNDTFDWSRTEGPLSSTQTTKSTTNILSSLTSTISSTNLQRSKRKANLLNDLDSIASGNPSKVSKSVNVQSDCDLKENPNDDIKIKKEKESAFSVWLKVSKKQLDKKYEEEKSSKPFKVFAFSQFRNISVEEKKTFAKEADKENNRNL